MNESHRKGGSGSGSAEPGASLARRALQRLKAHLERIEGLQDLLAESLAWRTVAPLLRGWMSPGTLGRGRTILDELREEQAALAAASSALEGDLVAPEVLWEASELALKADPPVSVLVTNRDGAVALSAFLNSYALHHDAEAAELVILDHASSDDSVEVVRAWMDRLPIQLLRCNRNQRYSVANNLARRYARGRILVFANNDIMFDEPVLPAMVGALGDESVGLAGVELWYPDAAGGRSDRCQHRGIRFRPDRTLGFMRPFNVQDATPRSATGRGVDDPDVHEQGAPVAVPAVTAALAACRVDDFDAVGGFVDAYDYGFEDVDLALTFRRQLGKRSVLCPVGAIHQEFGTQGREVESLLIERRADNARLLRRRHGAVLAREVTASQLDAGAFTARAGPAVWHDAPLQVRLPVGRQVAVDGPPGLEPLRDGACGDADRFSGVWLVDDPGELDEPPPRGAISIARIRGDALSGWLAAPAFRHLDGVLVDHAEVAHAVRRHSRAMVVPLSDADSAAVDSLAWLPGLLRSWLARPGIALKSATPNENERDSWGDFHFAEALGRALRDRGYRVRNDLHPDWRRPAFMPDDVSLVLRGLEACAEPLDGINLLWLISHPSRVSDAELERFDQVFVASTFYAGLLGGRLETPVSPLLQCTDPDRFPFLGTPGAVGRRLFVGNSKGYFRPMVKAALEAGESVDIWGTWWHEHIDESLVRGEAVPNEDLGALYGNSGVVLNDHWPDMARLGFLSNRLFDVASTGALIVTDPVRGLGDVFGEDVVVADGLPDRFPTLDGQRIAGRPARRALAERIVREHTFAVRAEAIDAKLQARGLAPRP